MLPISNYLRRVLKRLPTAGKCTRLITLMLSTATEGDRGKASSSFATNTEPYLVVSRLQPQDNVYLMRGCKVSDYYCSIAE